MNAVVNDPDQAMTLQGFVEQTVEHVPQGDLLAAGTPINPGEQIHTYMVNFNICWDDEWAPLNGTPPKDKVWPRGRPIRMPANVAAPHVRSGTLSPMGQHNLGVISGPAGLPMASPQDLAQVQQHIDQRLIGPDGMPLPVTPPVTDPNATQVAPATHPAGAQQLPATTAAPEQIVNPAAAEASAGLTPPQVPEIVEQPEGAQAAQAAADQAAAQSQANEPTAASTDSASEVAADQSAEQSKAAANNKGKAKK